MPAVSADFSAPTFVHHPREVEAQVEVSLDIPAQTRADTGDRDLQALFSGQWIVGRTGKVIEQQAAQIALAGDQFADQVGCGEF